jgi:copper chaperone CopZ
MNRTLPLAMSLALLTIVMPATNVSAQEPAKTSTKATYLITGLHCPPCTRTVEGSLARIKGVKSVSVNWATKNAKIEFDESVLPAQALAAAVEGTPHMMGGGMRYRSWLALKVPSITDDASGAKVKEALGKIEGVKSVAVYPEQHSAAVLFSGKGSLSSQHMIEVLGTEGIEASIF